MPTEEPDTDIIYASFPKEIQREFKKQHSVFKELLEESDRAVAIIGGALVDEALERLLKSKVRKEMESLFKYPRPLGTASARIDFAYAIRIIGKSHYDDLGTINEIRNFFAHKTLVPDAKHKLAKVTFETQAPRDWCKSFSEVKIMEKQVQPMTSRMRFLVTIFAMTTELMSAWLYPDGKKHLET